MRTYLKTKPTSEPVTASEVKLHTRITHAVEDDLINTWIKAARIEAENFQTMSYFTQTWQLIYDSWPNSVIQIPRPPLASVSSVKYYDTDDTEYTFSSDNYYVDTLTTPGRLSLNYGVTWPTTILRPINGLIIEYVAGYDDTDDIPENVKEAIMIYCTHRYESRSGEIEFPEVFYNILHSDSMEGSR